MIRFDEMHAILESFGREFQHEAFRRTFAQWALDFKHSPCPKIVVSGLSLQDDAVLDFGHQMLAHRVLPLPADQFYFEWTHTATVTHVASKDDPAVGTEHTYACGMFVRVLWRREDSLKISLLRVTNWLGGTAYVPVAADVYGEKARGLLNADIEQLNDEDKDIRTHLDEMLSVLSLMSIKDVKKTETRPAARLKAKRADRGLPPLPEYVTLHVSRSIMETEREAAGIPRNSPRPHFRRGHIRMLRMATGDQRPVAVSPSWVNAAPGNARVPGYVVKP